MYDENMIRPYREEMTSAGFQEVHTAEEVDSVFSEPDSSAVNSAGKRHCVRPGRSTRRVSWRCARAAATVVGPARAGFYAADGVISPRSIFVAASACCAAIAWPCVAPAHWWRARARSPGR